MSTLTVGRRVLDCNDQLRKAIDDLVAKYPKSWAAGLLDDSVFLSVQHNIEDELYRSEDEIRSAACQAANDRMRSMGAANFAFTL